MDINVVVDRFIKVTALKEKIEVEYRELKDRANSDNNPSAILLNYLDEVQKKVNDINLIYDQLRNLYISTLHNSTDYEIELSVESIKFVLKSNEEQIKVYKNKRDSAVFKLFGDLTKEELREKNDIINFCNEKLNVLLKETMIYENFCNHLESELNKRKRKRSVGK